MPWWYQHLHDVCRRSDLGTSEQEKRKFSNHFQSIEAEEKMSTSCPNVYHMGQQCYHG
jgi:hypothetical protein